MTLMPVYSTSRLVLRSSNFGASRCMGYAPLSLSRVFRPSMLSPITLSMRPLICSPVGMEIGAPVGYTSSPRESPSVLSMATVRTVSSPICCCTSMTIFLPSGCFTISASWILGRTFFADCPSVGKHTSTTGPIICKI